MAVTADCLGLNSDYCWFTWIGIQVFSLSLSLSLSLSFSFSPDQRDKPKIHEKVNQLWVSALVWGGEEVGLWPLAAMPPSVLDKALIGVAGAAGAGILAWQTQFPWIKYDIQIIQVRTTLIQPFWMNLSTFIKYCHLIQTTLEETSMHRT